MKLHQQIVRYHAAIGAQDFERNTGIFFHGLDHFARLNRGGFKDGARQVALVGVPRQTGDHAARVVLPVRRIKAGKRGHEINAAIVLHRTGQVLDVRAVFDQPEVVAYPLHQRAGDGHAAFKRIHRGPAAQPVRDRSQHAVCRGDGLRPRVHEQKTSGAISVFGLAGSETGLTNKRGLLIAQDARYRHAL